MAYTKSKSESYFWRKRERERQKDRNILDEGQLLHGCLTVNSVQANYWVPYCKTAVEIKG